MYYFIGFLVVVFVIAANLKPQRRRLPLQKKVWNAERFFIFSAAFILFLILALQDTASNADLQQYSDSFRVNGYRSFSYFQRNWFDIKDPFYTFCAFCFSKLGLNFFAWKALISAFFVYSFYRLIVRYSANAAISFLTLLSLGMYAFACSGLRQTIALSILALTYPYLKGKKPLKFLVLVLLAGLFHSTAWICVVIYPLYRLRAKVRNILLLMVLAIPVLLAAPRLVSLYLSLVGTEEIYSIYLETENSLSIAGVIIWGCVWLFCTVVLYRKKADAADPHLCNLLLVSLVIRILSTIWIAEFFRISMYFSVFECLAIADACASKESSKLVVRLKTAGVSMALGLYFIVAPNANLLNYSIHSFLGQ